MLFTRSQIASYALMFALMGCGDDEPAQGAEVGDGDATEPGSTHYTASVTDSSSDMPIGGLNVFVLDNKTGMKTGQKAQTDANGKIALDDVQVDADGKFGVLVEGKPGDTGFLDTFQYNLNPNAQNDILRIVATGAIALATAAANFDENPATGPVSGAVFTGTGAADRLPADCLTIELEGFEDAPVKTGMRCTQDDLCVRYFFDQRIPDFGATHTSAANGRFYIANVPPGPHTLHVIANGQKIASTSLVVTARNQGTTGETISVANIYLGAGDTNPAKGSCE
ncbi:MAG: carboxypeptidase-like regulatory domain-containing protein [Myxococcales bacterium]